MNYKSKLNHIKAFAFDVDGVLSDGKVYLIGEQVARAFTSRDGYAIQLAVKLGYKVFIITGGTYGPVKQRLLDLGCTEVHLGSSSKVPVYKDILDRHDLKTEEVLYMGDDMPDIKVLEIAGCSSCPADAATDVKMMVDYVSPYKGGHFAVRDVIEQTMRVQGKWGHPDSYEW